MIITINIIHLLSISSSEIIQSATPDAITDGRRAGCLCFKELLAAWVPVCLLWAGLLWRLRLEWEWSETYRFGYWVPALVALLIALRVREARSLSRHAAVWKPVLVAVIGAATLFPCELLLRANPDWRGAYWFYGCVAFAGSIAWLTAIGGKRHALHFAPGLALLFLAIPWPTAIEQSIVQSLTRVVTMAGVETANLLGIPARLEGNVIALSAAARIGVEDACSGLRSIQSALMVAWFFGELMRLRAVRRTTLLAFGLLLALLLNAGRIVSMVVFANRNVDQIEAAQGSLESIHDMLGSGAALALFIGVWWIASWLKRPGIRVERQKISEGMFRGSPAIAGAITALVAWIAVMGASAAWFRSSSSADQNHRVQWDLDWTDLAPAVTFRPIPSRTEAMLRCSSASHAIWEPPGHGVDVRVDVYLLEWNAGRISSFANVHQPEICLPAAGIPLQFQGKWSTTLDHHHCASNVEAIMFDTWSSGRELHVFFASRTLQSSADNSGIHSDAKTRIIRALQGESIHGRQTLEILVSGVESTGQARAVAADLIANAVRIR